MIDDTFVVVVIFKYVYREILIINFESSLEFNEKICEYICSIPKYIRWYVRRSKRNNWE